MKKTSRSFACKTFSLLVMSLALATHAYATRHERLIETWQPTNFNVTIKFDDRLAEITKARTEITVKILKDSLTVVDLDFGELPIDGVWIDGHIAQFDRANGKLNVHLQKAAKKGTRFVIAIAYHGAPKDGLILTSDKDGKPSATGDNWPDRVHNWIPCLDHPSAKATVTFTVTAPAKDLVVANGKLDQVKNDSPTTRTWTYTEGVPIPAYCMVIAAGEYAKSEPASSAVTPLAYYVPQSDAKFATRGFAAAAPSLQFYSETIAPYPYEKLALIVGKTRFGGMENSSAIVFPPTLLGPRDGPQRMSRAFNINQSLEEVVAHEIAHQWFGDSVTESTWSDLWLSEGFATYFAGLVLEKYDGEDSFRAYMKRGADAYFAFEKNIRIPIHDTETEDLFKLLNQNNYEKGAWVLHMLRGQLGDDAFFRGLKIYYNAHKESTASSDDLRSALEKASGQDLKEFFARWIYGTGHPQYQLTWEWIADRKKVKLMLRQLQIEPAFPNTVPIDVLTKSGKRRILVKPTSKEAIETFDFEQAPSAVVLDPESGILKELVNQP